MPQSLCHCQGHGEGDSPPTRGTLQPRGKARWCRWTGLSAPRCRLRPPTWGRVHRRAEPKSEIRPGRVCLGPGLASAPCRTVPSVLPLSPQAQGPGPAVLREAAESGLCPGFPRGEAQQRHPRAAGREAGGSQGWMRLQDGCSPPRTSPRDPAGREVRAGGSSGGSSAAGSCLVWARPGPAAALLPGARGSPGTPPSILGPPHLRVRRGGGARRRGHFAQVRGAGSGRCSPEGEPWTGGALQTLLPQPHQRAEEPVCRRCPDGCPGAVHPAAPRPAGSPGHPPPPRHPSATAPVPGRAQSRQQAAARWSRARRVPSMLGRSALAPPAAPGRRRGGPAAGAGRAARGPAPAPEERGGGGCWPHTAGPVPHMSVSDSALSVQSRLGPRHPRFGSHCPQHHQLVPGTLGSGRTPLVQSNTGLGTIRAVTSGSDRTPPVLSFCVLGILSPGLHHLFTP